MSSSKGNNSRSRPQKHQNRSAFKNDLHDTSKRTKFINSLEVKGVCQRCKDVIEWKIKYKKYKPLTAPATCVGCGLKSVKYAYHIRCTNCATEKKICAKCSVPINVSLHSLMLCPNTHWSIFAHGAYCHSLQGPNFFVFEFQAQKELWCRAEVFIQSPISLLPSADITSMSILSAQSTLGFGRAL